MSVLRSVMSWLLLLAFIPLVRGGYELRMRAHSYSNPSHRHARGGCCDNPCSDHCDNYFVFCLRPAGYSHQIWRCPLGVIYTGEVGGDSLTFGDQIGNQQNPILFSNSGNWPGSFQLLIGVRDHDDPSLLNLFFGGFQFVDAIYIEESLQPNGSYSAPQPYTGRYQRGTISLSFRVSCTENFYGPNCATFCEPNDNYTCGTNGSIVCRPNHYGSQCATICKPTNRYQCDESGRRICHQNYYSAPECQTFCAPTVQYTCTTNGERRCRRNYYNLPNCTTFCMPRDDSQGHYTCSEDGRIRCLPGYYGPQCTIFCEPQVGQFDCNNSTGERLCAEGYYGTLCNVFCEGRNDSLGHYQCGQNGSKICLEGYQDPDTNCTTQLCEPECVATGGYCSASGLCQCYSGWRGRQCNECIPNMECSTIGGYCMQPNECRCREGYAGTGCEIVVDVCGQSDPCENGGSCSNDGTGGYSCLCPNQYTGVNCEIDINEGTTSVSEGTTSVSEGTPSVSEGTPVISEGTPVISEGTPVISEGTPSVSEGTPVISEGTPVISEGTPVISEGTPSVSEGTPVISEGTLGGVSEGTLAGNAESSSEFPNTGTMTPIANVGSNGQSASATNLGLVLGVVFAVLLLLSLVFVIVVVLTVLLCRGREKGVILLNEDRPRNLSLENPTYIPSTLGHHAAGPESTNSQQEYNLYNPLYSERDIDLSHYETVDRDSRTSQMSEIIYSTIDSGSRQSSRIPPSSSQTPLVSNEGHYETLNDYATEYMRMPPDDSSR